MCKAADQLRKAGVKKIFGNMDLEDIDGTIIGKIWFVKVPLETVFIDSKYQRRVYPKHVANIVANWDIRAARPLALSLRNRRLMCYDGQQTQNALLDTNYVEHHATVLTGLTFEDECRLFFYLNDIPKKMAGWNKFDTAVKSNQPVYVKVLKAADKHRLTTPLHPNVHKATHADITCASILLYAFKRGGIHRVNQLCRILSTCWRTGRTGPVQEGAKKITVLRGLVQFLMDHDELPQKTIEMVLNNIGADELQKLANEQESKGRIDATQVKNALEGLFFNPPPSRRKAA